MATLIPFGEDPNGVYRKLSASDDLGVLKAAADPTDPLGLATKQYVDANIPLVYTTTLGANASTLTLSGLSLDDCQFICKGYTNANTNTISLYINGDTTPTNYSTVTVYATGSSAAGFSFSGSPNGAIAVSNIMSTNTYFLINGIISRFYDGTNTVFKMLFSSSSSTYTATHATNRVLSGDVQITGLTLSSNRVSGLRAGTQLKIMSL